MGFHRFVDPSYNLGGGTFPGTIYGTAYDRVNVVSGGTGTGGSAFADNAKVGGPNDGTYWHAFGEDATSNYFNRGMKALSENTDVLDNILHRDLAAPVRTASVASSGQTSVAITGEVWLDTNPATPLAELFSVLDGFDREIIDTTTGTQVVDVVVGALGHRQALFGYLGHIPEMVEAEDVLQVLNIGGVLGICDSINPDKGKPFDCRVLGCVLQFPFLGERIGVPAQVGHRRLDHAASLHTHGVPVVALAGTCMEAGKTAASCAIVSRMRHRGLNVHAFKATGVSLRCYILAMEDSGARRSMIFTDLGIVTTTARSGPALTRTMLNEMAAGKPDVIVLKLARMREELELALPILDLTGLGEAAALP